MAWQHAGAPPDQGQETATAVRRLVFDYDSSYMMSHADVVMRKFEATKRELQPGEEISIEHDMANDRFSVYIQTTATNTSSATNVTMSYDPVTHQYTATSNFMVRPWAPSHDYISIERKTNGIVTFTSGRILQCGETFRCAGDYYRVIGCASGGAYSGLCEPVRSEQKFISKMERQGYECVSMFPDGTYAGVLRQIFNARICIGLDDFGYKRGICYETMEEAIVALSCWLASGEPPEGNPPGLWIKDTRSGLYGPGATGLNDQDSTHAEIEETKLHISPHTLGEPGT